MPNESTGEATDSTQSIQICAWNDMQIICQPPLCTSESLVEVHALESMSPCSGTHNHIQAALSMGTQVQVFGAVSYLNPTQALSLPH